MSAHGQAARLGHIRKQPRTAPEPCAEQGSLELAVPNLTFITGCALLVTDSGGTASGGHMAGVPQTIHQTFKNRDLHNIHRAYHRAWRALHPGWKMVLWNDAELRLLVRWHYPWFEATLAIARRVNRITEIDAMRVLLLHRFGGAYMDLDVEPFRSLDAILAPGTQLLVSKTPHMQAPFADPAHIISRARHPAWIWAANHYSSSIARALNASKAGNRVFDAAGPHALGAALDNYEGFLSSPSSEARRLWTIQRFSIHRYFPKPGFAASKISMHSVNATAVVPCHRTLAGCTAV